MLKTKFNKILTTIYLSTYVLTWAAIILLYTNNNLNTVNLITLMFVSKLMIAGLIITTIKQVIEDANKNN